MPVKAADANITFHFDNAAVSKEKGFVDTRVIVTAESSRDVPPPTIFPSDVFHGEIIGDDSSWGILGGVSGYQRIFTIRFALGLTAPFGLQPMPRVIGTVGTQAYEVPFPAIEVVARESDVPRPPAVYWFRHAVNKSEVFVGEQILYTVSASSPAEASASKLGESEWGGVWREEASPPHETKVVEEGIRLIKLTLSDALFPTTVGEFRVPARVFSLVFPAVLPASSASGSVPIAPVAPLRDAFNQAFDPVSVINDARTSTAVVGRKIRRMSAPPLTITVKPLPVAPSSVGYVPVGEFSMKSTLHVDRTSKEGSIVLSSVVISTGNLRPLQLNFPDQTRQRFEIREEEPIFVATMRDSSLEHRKEFRFQVFARERGLISLIGPEFTGFDPKLREYRKYGGEELKLEAVGPGVREIESLPYVADLVNLRLPRSGELSVSAAHRQAGVTNIILLLLLPPSIMFFWKTVDVRQLFNLKKSQQLDIIIAELEAINADSTLSVDSMLAGLHRCFCQFAAVVSTRDVGIASTTSQVLEHLTNSRFPTDRLNETARILESLDKMRYRPFADPAEGRSEARRIIQDTIHLFRKTLQG